MAVAMKCLELARERNIVDKLDTLGGRLSTGLRDAGAKHGFSFSLTGPPAMPFPWFAGDDNLYLLQQFCELCALEGVFFHPHHNWFLCGAHDEGTIDQAVEVASVAFSKLTTETT
jgi:glutamate-1-semialdehyde 2,1-aminomutase